MIPVWVLDRCADPRGIHLYAVLQRYADREGLAWPKRERLARDMETSPRSIERA